MNDFTDLRDRVKHLEERVERLRRPSINTATLTGALNDIASLLDKLTGLSQRIETLEKLHDKPTITDMVRRYGPPEVETLGNPNDPFDPLNFVKAQPKPIGVICHICHKAYTMTITETIDAENGKPYTCPDCRTVNER